MTGRKQVNIRLNAYIDDLLNAIVDKSGMGKTDIIYKGIEQVAIDELGLDLVNKIRLSQFEKNDKKGVLKNVHSVGNDRER